MAEHTVKAYEDELRALDTSLVAMGELALAQVRGAVTAIAAQDLVQAQAIVDRDAGLDHMEAETEQLTVRLIALRQPVAQDLRRALSALKIAGNLERIGDLAKNIAKRALVTGVADPDGLAHGSIARMGELVADRFAQVLTAHRSQDMEVAEDVWRRDAEIDQQYDSLFRELLTYMMADARMITPCAHLLFVAKNLERIGDHATNIAEVVHYQITGDPMPGTGRPKWDALEAR
ncbi:MAG: phosphate signaling complex protein PhoU [Pseudomonadota bacterium]